MDNIELLEKTRTDDQLTSETIESLLKKQSQVQ